MINAFKVQGHTVMVWVPFYKGNNFHGAAEILTLLHSERPKLYTILAFLSATGLSFGGKLID